MDPSQLCQLLDIQHPIIKAPMAGGIDTPELVAAVSNAGGMGMIGAAYLSPEQLERDTAAVRQLTRQPFGINLFVPEPIPTRPNPEAAISALMPLCQTLGITAAELPDNPALPYEALFEVALASGASALSFTFGLPPEESLRKAKRAGLTVIGTATSTDEARQLTDAGVDAVVAQGSEAGGHRGGFLPANAMIGSLALTAQISARTDLPVISAGGIMNGAGISAALKLGAGAAALGTAFMTCPEAGIPDTYKQAILNSSAEDTTITSVFSGRPARGIRNTAMQTLEQSPEAILPFPWQNSLTKGVRSASAAQNNADFLSLWAGQGLELARQLPAAELMAALIQEMDSLHS